LVSGNGNADTAAGDAGSYYTNTRFLGTGNGMENGTGILVPVVQLQVLI